MITVITGPPCAGKTTWVDQHAQPGDIRIDLDLLARALGSPTTHDHPQPIRAVARAARDAAITAAMRTASNVWIIDCDPTPDQLDAYRAAGATVRELIPDRAVLHERARTRDPATRVRIDEWLAARERTLV